MIDVAISKATRILNGYQPHARPPRAMNGSSAMAATTSQTTGEPRVYPAFQRAVPRQVVRQHEAKRAAAKPAEVKERPGRFVKQVLIDVVKGHQHQGQPLQGLDGAVCESDLRQDGRRRSDSSAAVNPLTCGTPLSEASSEVPMCIAAAGH